MAMLLALKRVRAEQMTNVINQWHLMNCKKNGSYDPQQMKQQSIFNSLKKRRNVKFVMCYHMESSLFTHQDPGISKNHYVKYLLDKKVIEKEWIHMYVSLDDELIYAVKYNGYILVIGLENTKSFNKAMFDISIRQFCENSLRK